MEKPHKTKRKHKDNLRTSSKNLKKTTRKRKELAGKHKERHGESQPQTPRSRLKMRGKANHKEKPHETLGTHT
jgi:hypothetical protein